MDNGLLRKDEGSQLLEVFGRRLRIRVEHSDARRQFLDNLAGVEDPKQKRRSYLGRTFIEVFSAEWSASSTIWRCTVPAQGTLYPDVIDRPAHETGHAARIRASQCWRAAGEASIYSGGAAALPVQGEVRKVGLALGLPEGMVYRQPFPGPGLSVRS